MFRVEMLPASHGDCIWIEYGEGGAVHRVLIDGGTPSTFQPLAAKINSLPKDSRHFDLFVVTHIDADHIGGAVSLLENLPPEVTFADVWFNGYKHLPVPTVRKELFAVQQGEELIQSLKTGHLNWNKKFCGDAVVVPDRGDLPRLELEGGMFLTLLSPGAGQLRNLWPVWDEELAKFRKSMLGEEKIEEVEELVYGVGEEIGVRALAESKFTEDTSAANGSSIALLAEYRTEQGMRRLLLGADAFPSVIKASLHRLLATINDGPRLHLDAFKLCHHGSKSNTDRELIEQIDCRRYLVSTDGTLYHHPDREGIARVIYFGGKEKKTIYFNYRSRYNRIWDSPPLTQRFAYGLVFPEGDQPGLTVDLAAD